MRKFGIALLGLLGGIIAGFLVAEIVARIAIGDSVAFPDSLPLALAVGCITPSMAVVGVVAALVLDGRRSPRDQSL